MTLYNDANDTNNDSDPGSHDRHLRRDPTAAGDLLHARLAHLAGLRGRGARHPRHLHHHRLQVSHHQGEILQFLLFTFLLELSTNPSIFHSGRRRPLSAPFPS